VGSSSREEPAGAGVNLIGHISGNFGLAVAARNTLRALIHRGERVCVLDVDGGRGRSGHDRSFSEMECDARPLPESINLFHVNPPDAVTLGIDEPGATELGDRLNVAVPFYELPWLPGREWVPFLENVDLVLAPTRHVAATVERSCPSARVRHYPQAVFLPSDVDGARAPWGLPEDAFVCFAAMDVSSDLERKNPWAAIEAFQRAFPIAEGANVLLAVKLNNARIARRYEKDAERLASLLGQDPRVRLFAESMPYVESLGLTAACDVCLSLHRAEGLGLNLMEAMSLGKPVVATGWSGNMDFMTHTNSRAVAYALVDVVSSHPNYRAEAGGPQQQWAEPDVADAAAKLRELYDDPGLRRSLGEQAAADMGSARERFLEADWVDEARALMAGGALASPEHLERAGRLEQLKHPGAKRVVRRRVGHVLRRLGLLR
jgi:glycosyltransferase involved in cell wall biosynthesis